jgi:hypothetical protein
LRSIDEHIVSHLRNQYTLLKGDLAPVRA